MDDLCILELYAERSEAAVRQTDEKYGRYCRRIAYDILQSDEDAEECVNDAYMRAWNSIPPKKPENLRTFLGKMVRNLALDRCERARAQKRGGGQYALALEEMEECVPYASDTEQSVDGALLSQLLNDFLAGMKPEARNIFMRRYWYLSSVKDIAAEFGFSESKVKMSLHRSREELKKFLIKEGVSL